MTAAALCFLAVCVLAHAAVNYHVRLKIDARERTERALLLRAALAKTGLEFAKMDKVAQTARGQITQEQYQQMLSDDLARMERGITDPDMVSLPEGMNG